MADTTKKTVMHTVRLPRLKEKDANQVEFYSVNGRNYLVERGKSVDVPEEVYEVICHSEAAQDEADAFADELLRREKEPKI